MITYSDFEKVEIRAGTIVSAELFSRARKPAIKMEIDFGDLGIKKSSAQITKMYTPEDLPGRQVLAVTNFPPKQIADMMSECLVLGIVEGDKVTLIRPDGEVANGSRLL